MASKDPIREQPPPQGIEIKATQDQFFGFYRGIAPGVTGSLATGATYFGVIESTKKWIEESHPNLGGHLVHFIAGAIDKIQVLSKTAQGKKVTRIAEGI
ncbi:PREDICTED: uncharacterized protein LOC106339782 isoform X2 [Brassica oleracea var. oleracea]|uniref:Uncharacterized protein n=1 Tax=Brassica oleracea var. oleracea TaxID=109376 RepID=A0A0D3BQE3_BRAOL|nr:PREDICTED: uncharacterized protein LOC106329486 isoform X2 [Brassica oleracea var. oleracea]XP_013634109.1 PREDICTED: uncharacterized protein LOC106339782 isoform X2 [Brassica oleracea var. oleracea]